MTDEKGAYDRASEVAGSNRDWAAATTEHRERAGADPEGRDESRPEERAEQEGYRPPARPPSRTTRKDRD